MCLSSINNWRKSRWTHGVVIEIVVVVVIVPTISTISNGVLLLQRADVPAAYRRGGKLGVTSPTYTRINRQPKDTHPRVTRARIYTQTVAYTEACTETNAPLRLN